MIQHEFEQFRIDLGQISNTFYFHESITQHLSTVAIELSEKEMTRETFGSSNLGLIRKKF